MFGLGMPELLVVLVIVVVVLGRVVCRRLAMVWGR